MNLKIFLLVAVALEAPAGFALVISPSRIAMILLGEQFDTAPGLALGRLTGIALISLGLICWFARNDEHSPATKGAARAMLFYNLGAAAVLVYAALQLAMPGVGLWPAVILHAALAIWGISIFRKIGW